MSENYSPELAEIIANKLLVPEDWVTIQTLIKDIGISKATLRKYIEV